MFASVGIFLRMSMFFTKAVKGAELDSRDWKAWDTFSNQAKLALKPDLVPPTEALGKIANVYERQNIDALPPTKGVEKLRKELHKLEEKYHLPTPDPAKPGAPRTTAVPMLPKDIAKLSELLSQTGYTEEAARLAAEAEAAAGPQPTTLWGALGLERPAFNKDGTVPHEYVQQAEKAYKKLALKHHPDKNGGVETNTFHAIKSALNVLKMLDADVPLAERPWQILGMKKPPQFDDAGGLTYPTEEKVEKYMDKKYARAPEAELPRLNEAHQTLLKLFQHGWWMPPILPPPT